MSNKLGLKKQRELAGFIDKLHVYSAGCSWHGPISQVGKTKDLPETIAYVGNKAIKIGGKDSGLPCCPYCGSMLFQIEENKWWGGAKSFNETHPNYLRFIQWSMRQNRCWANNTEAAKAYNTAQENWDFPYTHNI